MENVSYVITSNVSGIRAQIRMQTFKNGTSHTIWMAITNKLSSIIQRLIRNL